MNFADVAEQPRHTIASARVNPAAELARWLFERYRISYHEEPHLPFLREIATRREADGLAVVGSEGVWRGVREMLAGIDAKSRPGQRLFGEDDTERNQNRALVERLNRLLRAVRLQLRRDLKMDEHTSLIRSLDIKSLVEIPIVSIKEILKWGMEFWKGRKTAVLTELVRASAYVDTPGRLYEKLQARATGSRQ